VGEVLQKLRPASLGDPGRAVRHEVLLQSRRLHLRALHRQRDAWIALDVPDLLPVPEVGEHDLVAVEAGPHDRDLW
jgi:hypothetical protein